MAINGWRDRAVARAASEGYSAAMNLKEMRFNPYRMDTHFDEAYAWTMGFQKAIQENYEWINAKRAVDGEKQDGT